MGLARVLGLEYGVGYGQGEHTIVVKSAEIVQLIDSEVGVGLGLGRVLG